MKRLWITAFTLSFLLLTLTACGGKKIDLSEAYTIHYTGNDGEGKASVNTLREGMEPNYSGYWSGSPIYNQTILLYSLKMYHHKAPEGIDYYVPVFLNNIALLSNDDLDFQVADINLQKADIRNIADDYKSLYINRHVDKYEGIEISADDYIK